MDRMRRPVVGALSGLALSAGLACAQADLIDVEGITAECARPSPEWLWCDDFEQDRLGSYFEFESSDGSFDRAASVGTGDSYGMRVRWMEGQVSAGALHLAVGRSPDAYRRSVASTETDFREIFWRVYVRNEPGWTGGGGYKLSRALVFHSRDNWGPALIASVNSGGPANTKLRVDPSSGTDEAGNVRTVTYNDFTNLRWLGEATSTTNIFDVPEIGKWQCIEAQVTLNDPGRSNGSFRAWIDDRLEIERVNLNWVGSYDDFGLNAVFLENYWNGGSPATQERYFDNFVVSTERIGCGEFTTS